MKKDVRQSLRHFLIYPPPMVICFSPFYTATYVETRHASKHERSHAPKNKGLNWFIPALVNNKVGSSMGTHVELGQNVCWCFFTKKSIKVCRTLAMGHFFDFAISSDSKLMIMYVGALLIIFGCLLVCLFGYKIFGSKKGEKEYRN